jgi:predicted NAD/FAD-binding protein
MMIVAFSYTWLMILTLWLHHRGHLRNAHHPVAKLTLGQWLENNWIHPYFVHQVFVPLFAAVCTNSWGAMLNYPAAEVLGKPKSKCHDGKRKKADEEFPI